MNCPTCAAYQPATWTAATCFCCGEPLTKPTANPPQTAQDASQRAKPSQTPTQPIDAANRPPADRS
jgi:hypothetical protein